MTPEPTPVAGIVPPMASGLVSLTVIRTTAGLTFAATSMIAEDSSSVTGCFAPTVVPPAVVAAGAREPRSSAPEALSAKNVPPEPRTAARMAARITWPSGDERRPRGVTATVSGRAVAFVQPPRSALDSDQVFDRDHSALGSGV